MTEARHALCDLPVRFLDIETLGLEPHHPIVEIAIVDEEGKTLLHERVRPPGDLDEHAKLADPHALEWSGFADADTRQVSARYLDLMLTLDNLKPELEELLCGAQIWGHSVWFDVQKLRDHFKGDPWMPRRFGLPFFGVETLAAIRNPKLTHFSLVAIAETLGISTDGAHTALADACMAQQIYAELRDLGA